MKPIFYIHFIIRFVWSYFILIWYTTVRYVQFFFTASLDRDHQLPKPLQEHLDHRFCQKMAVLCIFSQYPSSFCSIVITDQGITLFTYCRCEAVLLYENSKITKHILELTWCPCGVTMSFIFLAQSEAGVSACSVSSVKLPLFRQFFPTLRELSNLQEDFHEWLRRFGPGATKRPKVDRVNSRMFSSLLFLLRSVEDRYSAFKK